MYTGLFNINSNVEFYAGPLEQAKQRTKGMIYMVLSVTSTFAKGKFMQELDLVMWTDVTSSETSSLNGRESAKNEAAKSEVMRNLIASNAQKNPTGLGLPPPITENANQLAAVEFGNAPAQTLAQTNRSILTSQGVSVADDDASGSPLYAGIPDDEKNGRTI